MIDRSQHPLGAVDVAGLRAVLDASPVPMAITRLADGTILQANPACLEMLGWSEAEFVGASMQTVGLWARPERREQMLERLRADGRVRDLEEEVRTRGGETRIVLLSISPVQLDGEPCLVGQLHDITERRRLELALRESEARFRQVTETVKQAVMLRVIDPPATLYASPAAERIFGLSLDVLYSDPMAVQGLLHPDDVDRVMAERAAMSGPSDFEFRIVRPDGQTRWIRSRAEPVRSDGRLAARIASVIEDVTDEHELREALREGEERFRLLAENSTDVIARTSTDAAILYVSPACRSLYGYEPQEMVGRRGLDFVHPEDLAALQADIAARPDRRHDVAIEYRVRRKDGSYVWVEAKSTALRDPVSGEVIEFHTVVRNIAERKAAEERLRTSEQQFRLLVDSIEDYAVVMLDATGHVAAWNTGAQRIKGYTTDEILGRHFRVFYPPELVRSGHPERELELAISSGSYQEVGERMRKDGSRFWADVTLTPVHDHHGALRGFAKVTRDISQRKQAEELLERRRRQLTEAQSLVGLGSWEWDVARDRIEWSDELCRIYGLEPGYHPTTLTEALDRLHSDDRALVETAMQAALDSAQPFLVEPRIVLADGSVRIVQTRGEVIASDDGTPPRMLGTGQDITEQRAAERTKDEFISVVSHELRTPLTSIRGALGLLSGGVLAASPAKGERMLQIALENSDRLVRLINDMLDIERIDSGMIELNVQHCDMAELIGRAIQGLEQVASAAEVRVAVDVEAAPISADRDRVLQTLTNVLGNALKFSPPGGTVGVSCRRRDADVIVAISDEGRGVPNDKLESIFGRFQQVDASDSREKGGTGLGLAICRRIVEQHGGRIWAESDLGCGSTFMFTLPAAPAMTLAGGDGR